MPDTNPFEQAIQANPQAAQAAQEPASNPFEAATPPTPVPASTTSPGGTPSYLDEVQKHVTNTAKALWHGVSGTEETPEEKGTTTTASPEAAHLGLTNEHLGYNIGATARGYAGFFGNLAKDVLTMKPLPAKGTNLEENSPELAKSLVGKYIAAPSIAERDKAAESLRQYYNAPDTATAVSHGLSYMIQKGAQWIPMVGPFAEGIVDTASKGDIGGALAQLAALEAFGKASEHIVEPIKNKVGLSLLSPEDQGLLKDEAARRAAAAKQAEAARTAGANAAKAQVVPPPTSQNTPIAVIGPQPRTIAGERTTLAPTTQTTAGVEAPISAIQQENPSAVTKVATGNLTNPGAAREFQKTETIPAATQQRNSVVGQVAEDKINRHNAIMEGKPTPDQVAGTQTPSKFQTHDEAAQAMEATAQKTYKKADAASDADIAAWQQAVKEALNEHKEALDRHNANIDEFNANLAEGETPMQHAVYDPNAVSIPEKPQSYSELKAELDRAKAEGASSDAAVREQAYKTGIPKAEKAVDNWFKQHSDVISPAEYDSAKKLYADSQRFQEIANGLRAADAKGTLTGNTLRGLEANMDNRMIRRGQGPGAFRRLLGEDGYANWQSVTKLFDPIKGAPKGIKSWGVYALEAAAAIASPALAATGIVGTMGTRFLMDRIMFNPAWGQWFSKLATNLKDMVTREHGELEIPGTGATRIGEKFGPGGAKQEFDNLMNQAQGKAAADVRTQAQPAQAGFAPEGKVLKDIPLPEIDESSFSFDPELLEKYSKLTTPAPPIEMGKRGNVQDGNHRVEAARMRGEKTIKAYVPETKAPEEPKAGPQNPFETKPEVPPVPPVSPAPVALPEAKPATEVTPEYVNSLKDKEIATSNPQTVNADTTNNPDRTSGMKTLNDASPKMKVSIAQAIANYKDSGLKLTPEELENPGENSNSIIQKAVSHYKDNLVALYNSIPESIRGISKQWYESAHDISKNFATQYGIAHEQAAAVIAALSPNNPWDNNVGMAQRLMERWKNDRTRLWDEKMDEKLSSIRNAKSTKPEFRGFLDSIRGKQYNELHGDTDAETAVMRGLWLRMADQAYGSPEVPVYAPDGTIRGSQKIAWGPYDAVAKAVNLLDDGSVENINRLMGNGHKIRNFYNNIINPWSDRGHVTIDTHAVGAAHWKPFSQKDVEVAYNFGGSTPGVPGAGKHSATGLGGTYPVYDEAYKQAAKEVGVSPRELQSITWEGTRSLFSREGKKGSIRQESADAWRQAAEGKITKDEARKQIIEKAGGFKRPVWTTDNQWDASQGKEPVNPNGPASEAGIGNSMNQTVTVGTGENQMSADVPAASADEKIAKWKDQPQPRLVKKPGGKVPAAQLNDVVDWYNANTPPETRMRTTAHEIAHEFLQNHHGVPMEGSSISLGHSRIPGRDNALSAGYLQTGPGWNDRLRAARQPGGDMPGMLRDYSTQMMGGKAMEEMLGESADKVREHSSGDVADVKRILKSQGVHPILMDRYLDAATERAKGILKENWNAVRHMTEQAVQHYGSKIDAPTLQKYREGGTYKK